MNRLIDLIDFDKYNDEPEYKATLDDFFLANSSFDLVVARLI